MKLSIFTPTHRPRHLPELYASIQRQQGDVDWEWVIVVNGNCRVIDVPEVIRNDPHVRVIPTDISGIGALKKYACAQCRGDVYVEVDHDDVLASDAFKELAEVYERTPDGFYYSDFINVRENGSCETYGFQFGWQVYKANVDGNDYVACRAFPPTARALCQIFYAPNHIRAWSAKAYELSGGHDVSLAVGDDHELLCRTYIKGVPFVWIQKPLYIYRRWNYQSFIEFNEQIQVQQQKNFNKYLHDLIAEECLRDGTRRLDVGRQEWCSQGYESCDLSGHDVLPYDDNSIGCVRAVDAFQRLPRRQIVPMMNEMHRILRPGGWIISSTPSIDDGAGKIGRGAFQDPSHRSYWSENNFPYFTQKKYANMLSGYTGRFQLVRRWTDYPTDWHKQNFVPYVHADMCALKGQRQPGVCEI
jgi:glycosyltransferase involved in cell wall biosynthesis